MIDPHKVSKTVEEFFDIYHHSDLKTRACGDPGGHLRNKSYYFTMPAMGSMGIFKDIIKEPSLRLGCTEFLEAGLIHVQIGIQYNLNSGGSNGNSIVVLELGLDYTLKAYRYEGKDPVYIAVQPAQES